MRLEALDHATTKSVRHAVELITKLDPRRLCRQILRHREFKLQNLAQRCRFDRSPSNKNRSITIAPVGTGTVRPSRPAHAIVRPPCPTSARTAEPSAMEAAFPTLSVTPSSIAIAARTD